MNKALLLAVSSAICYGQVTIPDGTKIRVRLDQTITSATADEGQTVELSVTENVKLGNKVVIQEGAPVTGTVTVAVPKRRMGRAGKLDFSLDRVRAVDGEWIPLRYTLNKKSGESHAVRTGVLTAGVAVVFWPAAPVFLLMHGKDVTINKGVVFDVFTDRNHHLTDAPPANVSQAAPAPQPPSDTASSVVRSAAGAAAAVTFTCNMPGADIEVDGAFAGNTPTTLQLSAGRHSVVIKSGMQVWQRTLEVTAGSIITLNAAFQSEAVPAAVRTARSNR